MSPVGRLLHAKDFEKVLAQPSRVASKHFTVHGLQASPSRPKRVMAPPEPKNLSTDWLGQFARLVDKPEDAVSPAGQDEVRIWLGLVIPKRWARRSVTRSLMKRQVRASVMRHAEDFPPGLWVVRLRSNFDSRHFTSAASDALRRLVFDELEQLMCGVTKHASA